MACFSRDVKEAKKHLRNTKELSRNVIGSELVLRKGEGVVRAPDDERRRSAYRGSSCETPLRE
jgi:hypothetical protein